MVRVRVAMLSCLAVCGSPIAGLACLRAFEVTGIGMGYSRDGARGGIYKDGFVRCWMDFSFSSSSSSSHLILPHPSSYLPS